MCHKRTISTQKIVKVYTKIRDPPCPICPRICIEYNTDTLETINLGVPSIFNNFWETMIAD